MQLLSRAGCGGAQPSPTATPAVPGPDQVALQYATDLFRGEVAQARDLVAPASRSAFGLVAAGVRPGTLSSKNLAVGSSTVTGTRAAVVLTGAVCHTASATTPATDADCLTNADPHSRNPIFRVDVALQPDHTWLVFLGLPGATAAPDPTAPVTSQAAGSR